jgi:chaperonin GroES
MANMLARKKMLCYNNGISSPCFRLLAELKTDWRYKMKLKPLFDKVVVKQVEASETTASGIVLPNKAQEKPHLAKVIAVGEGGVIDGKEIKMVVKVGDTVLYGKYAGSEFKHDGEELIILRQSDILAIVED